MDDLIQGLPDHEKVQVVHALAILASHNIFALYCDELTRRLVAGDPEASDEEILTLIRDTRQQVRIYRGLQELGEKYGKELEK